jgi:hypothetical protein
MSLGRPAALIFACALLLVCSAARGQGAATAVSTMTANIVEGGVMVQLAGASSTQALVQGAVLHEGDVVRTGADGRVEISLPGGSTLRLGQNAAFELRELAPERKRFRARLWIGSLWAKVHKLLHDEAFQIETDNAVAGVRGTEFLVEAGAEAGEDRVRVYEGAVEVREHKSQWTHVVEPGHELAFRRGAQPGAPRPFDVSADTAHPLMRWVREHPVQLERQGEPSRRESPRESPKEERKNRRRDRLLRYN